MLRLTLLALLLTLAACGGAPLTAEQCDRVNNFWAARAEYFTKQTLTIPTAAHLTTYALLSLYTDDLARNPQSEAVYTPKDIQSCRAAGG